MSQNYKSIFLYNKNDELITFVDVFYSGELVNYYNLKDKKLTKINVCTYKEKKKNYTERNKAIIIFAEDCSLFHTFIDSESRVVAQKKDSLLRESPIIISKIYASNEDNIESFTIDQNLLQSWIKKL